MNIKQIEEIALKYAPADSMENPAYPNHTDTDIYVAGFVAGVIWVANNMREIVLEKFNPPVE